MKVWVVVAVWVCWIAVVGPVSGRQPLESGKDHQSAAAAPAYEKVKFTTVGATKDGYTRFLEALRGRLGSEDKRHGIPVTRDPSAVPDSERFLLVELSTWPGESVTLAVDVTNARVVAHQAGDESYFSPDAPDSARPNLFSGTTPHTLPFNYSYPALEKAAGAQREDIDLGILPLLQAVTLIRFSSSGQSAARGLIVAIQMALGGARFRYIERRVRQSIKDEYHRLRPDAGILSLENNWESLSSAIQQSNQGVFSGPVRLQRAEDPFVDVDSVAFPSLAANLGFMAFVCRGRASQFSPLIRSVAAVDGDDRDAAACATPEPTVRISGRNGLCVDVRDGDFHNGNAIQLWPCASITQANQMWTLKTDGSILSNGKCLTAYGYAAGQYVMIYDCRTAVTPATLWQVGNDGTIVNPKSALVLSAEKGNSGTTLTVDTNIHAINQGWLASNTTEPFVASIVGLQDLCMQANGDAVWMEICESSKAEQKWALYPDRSIRPQLNRDGCLTCSKDSQETVITILPCTLGSSGQRWVFRNDGTIENLHNGLVMDVRRSDPSLRQIIIWHSTGEPNQQWLPLL